MKTARNRNIVLSNRITLLHVISISALVLVLCLTTGCAKTLQQVTIPETVAWNQFISGIATPYNDIGILTIGDHISAEIIEDGPILEPFAYCHDPVANASYIRECDDPDNCEVECDTGYDYLGSRYLYAFAVTLDRENFTAGGVQLISDVQGLLQSISIAVNSDTSDLELTAGVSEGTLPVGSEMDDESYVIDNGFTLVLSPHDENFVACDGLPYLMCQPNPVGEEGADLIWVAVNVPGGGYTYDCCGIPLSLTLLPYECLGDCISDSLAKNCKGITGRDRAACNAVQIGNCHAAFHVPSSLNPEP
ncbi:MAG: hypothetical protein KAJ90_02700 [Desulfobacterales bacterium]|nr:hypothetical protein [Desulfobacterales bacterium]